MGQSATDQIVNDLRGQGFERIEIDNGINQIKAEAIRGTQKLEVVFDRATGGILKQEVERVRAGEDTRPGLEIRDRNRDFVDAGRVDDDRVPTTLSTTGSTGSTDADEIVRDLQSQGFTRIEVKNGTTQTKIEAIRGSEKVETVYDRATGAVIEREIERVDGDDDTRPGVEIRTRDRDFVDDRDDDDDDRRGGDDRDDDDDDRRGGDDRDDDDDDRRGGHDDDDRDDRDDDRGGRDDDDDDDRGRDESSDDDHGDDDDEDDDDDSDDDDDDDEDSDDDDDDEGDDD
jgi:phosphosulfolactate synthase (CoM biosynthesis protein A)